MTFFTTCLRACETNRKSNLFKSMLEMLTIPSQLRTAGRGCLRVEGPGWGGLPLPLDTPGRRLLSYVPAWTWLLPKAEG